MRLPRVRFTVRWMMAVVAVVSAGLTCNRYPITAWSGSMTSAPPVKGRTDSAGCVVLMGCAAPAHPTGGR
jgi:hypothetical protein